MQTHFSFQSKRDITTFQTMILSWWEKNKRDFPWRHTYDPYKILVSEMMLQQTQAVRVVTKFAEFVTAFPSIQSLAQATPASVLRMWKGMGYNRRALYLHNTAKLVVDKYDGIVPTNEHQLLDLPGLGTYTARAILVFAYKMDIAMVDTNIRQIMTHFFFDDVSQSEKLIQSVADKLVPRGKSWDWHQALMDYGALKLHEDVFKGSKVRSIKKALPFKETKRYFRGRIIDHLREKTYRQTVLIDMLCRTYGKSNAFYVSLLKTLKKEGFIEQQRGRWMLKQ